MLPTPLLPVQAQALIANTPKAIVPVLLKKPQELPCKKEAPKPELVRLEVARACGGPGNWWQVVDAHQTVEVKAVTKPDTSATWGLLNWGGNIKQVPRSTAAPNIVTCQLSGASQTVQINVYDLVTLAVTGGVRGESGKLYAQDGDVVVSATTRPNAPPVWKHLHWNAQGLPPMSPPAVLQGGDRPNERKLSQAKPGDIKVTATLGCDPTLGQKTVETTLKICKWPVLEVEELGFACHEVVNDGTMSIGKKFDRLWKKGRQPAAAHKATSLCQSPLCYPAGTKVKLWAKFKVTEKPTENEDLWVRGVATCKGRTLVWEHKVTVTAAGTSVITPDMLSDITLPPEVSKIDPLTIAWYMSDPTNQNKTWKAIGSSTHLLYITLRPPQKAPYWTLLDISCTEADGETTENGFVAAAFEAFKTHTGDGNGFRRKGDNVELSYYKDGVNTDGKKDQYGRKLLEHESPYYTKGILGRSDGTGRCGGWADLLIHLFAIHGVIAVREFNIYRPRVNGAIDCTRRFLVKKCTFTKGKLKKHEPYTHRATIDCVKQDGAWGQGKNNPQFDFGDHVFVEHNGNFYDPSYGIGPIVGQFAYEEKAIDGLAAFGPNPNEVVDFTQSGTPQFMSSYCSPGFVECPISATDTLVVIAARFGKKASKLFDHDLNKPLKKLRKKIKHLQAGDVVLVPREWAKAGQYVMLLGEY